MSSPSSQRARVAAEIAQRVRVAEGFIQTGRVGEALNLLRSANQAAPHNFAVLKLLGLACALQGDFQAALPHLTEAASLNRNDALVWNVLSVSRFQAGDFEGALVAADQTLRLAPTLTEALTGRGDALYALKRYAEAAESYDRAGQLDLKLGPHHMNLHHAHMLDKDPGSAWKAYEWRFTKRGGIVETRQFTAPRWHGVEDLSGKTILFYAEQGFGDAIQFARYGAALQALGARVILEVPEPLVVLLADLPGVAQVIARGEALPPFDFQCPMMSVTLAFLHRGEALEGAAVPYLRAPPAAVARFRERLSAAGPKVGLVVSGNPGHYRDAKRSLPLRVLSEGLPEGPRYFLIQKEPRLDDIAFLEQRGDIVLVGDELTSYAETAALCEALDLVITVDTSVAHLAGALGRPTWILLPHFPDWRWDTGSDRTPWYPTARTFRQTSEDDWASVTAAVRRELLARF